MKFIFLSISSLLILGCKSQELTNQKPQENSLLLSKLVSSTTPEKITNYNNDNKEGKDLEKRYATKYPESSRLNQDEDDHGHVNRVPFTPIIGHSHFDPGSDLSFRPNGLGPYFGYRRDNRRGYNTVLDRLNPHRGHYTPETYGNPQQEDRDGPRVNYNYGYIGRPDQGGNFDHRGHNGYNGVQYYPNRGYDLDQGQHQFAYVGFDRPFTDLDIDVNGYRYEYQIPEFTRFAQGQEQGYYDLHVPHTY